MSVPQEVQMRTRVSLPERAWEHGFRGRNRGTALAPLVLAPPEKDWQEKARKKKKLFGMHRIGVGNTEGGEAAVLFRRKDRR